MTSFLELKRKFEFIITISIFVVAIIATYFNIFNPENTNKITFKFSALVIFYLISYIFIHLNKRTLLKNKKIMNDINALILTNLVVNVIWLAILFNLELIEKLPSLVVQLLISIYSFFLTLGIIVLPGVIFIVSAIPYVYSMIFYPKKALKS